MSWIEVIRIRTDGSDSTRFRNILANYVTPKLHRTGLTSSHVFSGKGFQGDVMIILVWSTEKTNFKKSGLAFLLMEEMKRFGLTDYSSWEQDSEFDFAALAKQHSLKNETRSINE